MKLDPSELEYFLKHLQSEHPNDEFDETQVKFLKTLNKRIYKRILEYQDKKVKPETAILMVKAFNITSNLLKQNFLPTDLLYILSERKDLKLIDDKDLLKLYYNISRAKSKDVFSPMKYDYLEKVVNLIFEYYYIKGMKISI